MTDHHKEKSYPYLFGNFPGIVLLGDESVACATPKDIESEQFHSLSTSLSNCVKVRIVAKNKSLKVLFHTLKIL